MILPGTTYLVTRRCSERRYFLRPSAATSQIFLYVLAVAAERYQVAIHAVCVLSNHYHLLVTDTAARLPAFAQYLDALVARAMNASLGRWEGFWASGTSYSAVAHDSRADIVAKAAYVLANPVAAGLVQHGGDWPGIRTAPERLGTGKLHVPRPEAFFREKGAMPALAALELTVPAGFSSAAEFQELVAGEADALEAQARRTFAAEGRRFLGAARVLAQDPFARPSPGEPRRKLNPRVAAKDKRKRLEVLARVVAFVRDYREALASWRSGIRDVVFPAGTYRLRVLDGAPCAAFG